MESGEWLSADGAPESLMVEHPALEKANPERMAKGRMANPDTHNDCKLHKIRMLQHTKYVGIDYLDYLIDLMGLNEDLKTRFGITHITRIQVGDIDATKNRVKLKIRIDDVTNRHFSER